MAKIIIRPSGRSFSCDGMQTILEAALSSSVSLHYGCSIGTCGECKVRLVAGEIEKIKAHDYTISEANKLQGEFLACSYAAASPEVTIEALEASSSADIPTQRITAKIKSVKQVAPDIAILAAQTPRSARLRFLPSQNVRLTLGDGVSADLPIASCPCDDRNLEFHVRRREGDEFAKAVFERNLLQRPVEIDGPWGRVERTDIDSEFIYLVFGASFGAAKSVIEQQLANEGDYPLELHWFAAEQDFYLQNMLASWSDAFDTFRHQLIPIAGPEATAEALAGVLAQYGPEQLGGKRAFVAGPEPFAAIVRQSLEEAGLSPDRIWEHSLERSDQATEEN